MSKNKRPKRAQTTRPQLTAKSLAGPKPKGKRKTRQRRSSDLRVRRTRGRLSNALVQLMQGKPIDEVTVQEVLDHASVGRSTFYLHYRGKDDLFLSQIEDGLEMWTTVLSKAKEESHRLVPVEEFFGHAASALKFYRALVESGRIHAFFDLAQGYFARSIARRLREMGKVNLSSTDASVKNFRPADVASAKSLERELDARCHAIAGNLLALLRWYMDHGAKESPRAMDKLFHRIAWNGLQFPHKDARSLSF